MKFYQKWVGCFEDGKNEFFDVSVPGNIQNDYALYKNYGDVNYGYNCEKYKWMEEFSCIYKAELNYQLAEGQRLYFVSKGIDYEYEIFLNGNSLYSHEGMFSPVEIDITDFLEETNILEVKINKPPKAQVDEKEKDTRTEVREFLKPAVSYGWDLHPRIIPTGIWNETYLETRGKGFLRDCEVFYELSEDFKVAEVRVDVDCSEKCLIELFAPNGECVYSGYDSEFTLTEPQLWWCNGQGEPNLYTCVVTSSENKIVGKTGFRKIELVMNEGAWSEPKTFPKSRSIAPITIKLNGRCIFAKGSNWVSPEIFFGTINRDSYEPLIRLAKEAHMNIFRCWGGTIVNKDSFFELCDEYGIMVWQEFTLACNCYTSSKRYLNMLEEEASAIVKRVRRHPSNVLWCGGNELFNEWSGMTDQSPALRLLNSVCYINDPQKPFIMTSPLMGMGHGYYMFRNAQEDIDVFQIINSASCSAYPEFGVPSMTTPEILRRIIPADEINNMSPGTAWEVHHAFKAWEVDSWCAKNTVEEYFGESASLEEFCERTWLLQGEGLKAVFEEARRQKPFCSMAINWDYNEPWFTAAGSNIITYDAKPKKSYYCVQSALRPVLASAKTQTFRYYYGEYFEAELWLLNDSQENVSDVIGAYITIDGKEEHVLTWETGEVKANCNKRGHTVRVKLPVTESEIFTLKLKSLKGYDSTYTYVVTEKKDKRVKRVLN